MALRDRTKNLFADEMEDMLKTTPLENIRVIELCKRCGATPPAFYYHFRDKYELAAWIFLRDYMVILWGYSIMPKEHAFSLTADQINNNVSPAPGHIQEKNNVSLTADQLKEKRAFYQKALSGTPQSYVMNYIQDFHIRLAKDAMKRHAGSDDLTQEQLLQIQYHSCGILGILNEWLREDLTINTEELARFNYEHTPDFLREAFRDYPYPSMDILHRLGK
ncbi:MAG: TetR/AcrR family transcriptional regulator C-terminal domain-containing protein [Lachnospiraceae bacterium]|nr:TetR/AcrR family transcriptional regulator C-terminal domain-containing protein [Lachnospiraceae bacterium]